MVLKCASAYLPFPHPASSELVDIATFVEEDVSGFEQESRKSVGRYAYGLDLVQVEVASLHVGNAKIGHLFILK
jgi:hypothetical protein